MLHIDLFTDLSSAFDCCGELVLADMPGLRFAIARFCSARSSGASGGRRARVVHHGFSKAAREYRAELYASQERERAREIEQLAASRARLPRHKRGRVNRRLAQLRAAHRATSRVETRLEKVRAQTGAPKLISRYDGPEAIAQELRRKALAEIGDVLPSAEIYRILTAADQIQKKHSREVGTHFGDYNYDEFINKPIEEIRSFVDQQYVYAHELAETDAPTLNLPHDVDHIYKGLRLTL